MSSTTPIKGSAGIGGVLHRLDRLIEGITKFKASDPKFPDFSDIADFAKLRDDLGLKSAAAIEQRTLAQNAHGAFVGERTMALTAYQKAVLRIESYLGIKNPELRQFGIEPSRRGGKRKPKAAAGTTTHKGRKKGGTAAGSSTAAAPEAAPSAASEPAPTGSAAPASPPVAGTTAGH